MDAGVMSFILSIALYSFAGLFLFIEEYEKPKPELKAFQKDVSDFAKNLVKSEEEKPKKKKKKRK